MLEQLSTIEKKQFGDIVNKLLFKKHIIENIYDKSKGEMVANPDYRFIEIYKILIGEYLGLIDWQLNEDKNNGVFYISSETVNYNYKFNLFTSVVMLLLRLLYDKKQEEVALTSSVYFTLSELLEEGNITGNINKIPTSKSIRETMVLLRKFDVVEKVKGNYEDIDTMYVLYPSIIHIISSITASNSLREFGNQTEDEEDNQTEFGIEDENTEE